MANYILEHGLVPLIVLEIALVIAIGWMWRDFDW